MALQLRYSLTLLLVSNFGLLAQQSPSFQENHILYVEASTELPVLVVNDSTAYKGFNFNTQLDIQFPEIDLFLEPQGFYSISIQKRNFLIGGGCGPVVEINNQKIARIDHSFNHKNQYNGNAFSYDNSLYLWGGYGLFTFKNILVKYDFNTHEWGEVTTYGTLPGKRSSALQYRTENYLYVFGGYYKNPLNNKTSISATPTVWRLDLKTTQWEAVGTHVDVTFLTKPPKDRSFQAAGNIYYLIKGEVQVIDLVNNSVKTFLLKEWKDIIQIVYHPTKKWVSYTYKSTSGKSFTVVSEPLKNLLGTLKSETVFYKKAWNTKMMRYAATGFILLLLLLYIIKKSWQRHLTLNGLVYHTKSRTFTYRKKELAVFKGPIKELFIHLTTHNKKFLSLISLDKFFENPETVSGVSTIIKRRETAINDLRYKLSTLLDIPETTVFDTRKNPTDRRAIEIRLAVAILQTR
jgi:hypothetical protein